MNALMQVRQITRYRNRGHGRVFLWIGSVDHRATTA